MSNALDFLQSVSGYVQSQRQDKQLVLATIDPAYVNTSYPTTLPRVTFDGESTLSGKRYLVAGNYLPSPGDRVVMAPVANTYVILGSVSTPASRSLTYFAISKLSSDLFLTDSYQDLAGTTLTVTTRKANAVYSADAIFDIENTVGGTSYIMLGNLVVGSTTPDGEAHESNSGAGRVTVAMSWGDTLAAAGTYTFKLKAKMLNGGSNPYLYSNHTRLRLSVFE